LTSNWRRNTFTRRGALLAPLPVLLARGASDELVDEVRIDGGDASGVPFNRKDMGIVGVYDVDWLIHPTFTLMLDTFAASPGAVSGVRFFGIFTAGEPEQFKPESGGVVWTDATVPIDFGIPFAALAELTSRGLIPFVTLGFFPPAISDSPIAPPTDWTAWQRLIREFLAALVSDPRFGKDRIRDWWFEAWNEPNEGRFWSGTQDDYFALYRATSEVVVESGLSIRFGGPAIAYKPQISPDDGAPWMERFLRFIASDSALRCDFISLHRKGTVADDPPDPRRLKDVAVETRELMLAIDNGRFRGIPIINNEADEKVGFEVPYAPRMDQTNASWLAAVAAIQAALTTTSAKTGTRFMAAADNANLQLVQEPFDGRRSLLTYALAGSDELIRLPAFGSYEMLRLLEGRQSPVIRGSEHVFPESDLYHLTVTSDEQISSLVTWYPNPDAADLMARSIDLVIEGIPWSEVNIAVFRIDRDHSNADTVAGGSAGNPYPKPGRDQLPAMRLAQELALARPIMHRVAIADRTWSEHLSFDLFTTVLVWITPWSAAIPEALARVEVESLVDRTVIRWTPFSVVGFHSFEVFRVENGTVGQRLSPDPLRAAMWTDNPAATGTRYAVRVVTTSGISSAVTLSD
jgi:Glycosyl hydrolases family 39